MKKCMLVAVSIILTLLIVCLPSMVLTHKRIPLIDGLRFGMSPAQAAKILGEHCEVTHDVGGTGKTAYTYKIDVFGQETIVTCYFFNGRQLTEAYFLWDTKPPELYKQAYVCIYDYYHKNKDFFTKEVDDFDAETNHTSLGIDNGLTGVFYSLYETNTSLRITCVELS